MTTSLIIGNQTSMLGRQDGLHVEPEDPGQAHPCSRLLSCLPVLRTRLTFWAHCPHLPPPPRPAEWIPTVHKVVQVTQCLYVGHVIVSRKNSYMGMNSTEASMHPRIGATPMTGGPLSPGQVHLRMALHVGT